MITGHACLRYHLFNMKFEPSPSCEECGLEEEQETVEHFICHCEAYAWARQRVFGAMFLEKEDLRDMDYDVLLQYIRTTGRLF